jgi:glutamate racemase
VTIARYAVESAQFLVEQGAEYLVIACNTASALALDEIREAVTVPILGVIETGADAARACSISRDVLVIATTATVASHAYQAACRTRGLRALEKACPLLVPLVEEDWTAHRVTHEVLGIYLDELLYTAQTAGLRPDALVLGCTHYPLLRAAIEALLPPGIAVIDSAQVTASLVAQALYARDFEFPERCPREPIRFYATDGIERFRELGSRFLGEPIDRVTLVDLGG